MWSCPFPGVLHGTTCHCSSSLDRATNISCGLRLTVAKSSNRMTPIISSWIPQALCVVPFHCVRSVKVTDTHWFIAIQQRYIVSYTCNGPPSLIIGSSSYRFYNTRWEIVCYDTSTRKFYFRYFISQSVEHTDVKRASNVLFCTERRKLLFLQYLVILGRNIR